jgi:3-oxoacyl-[acyl-carrier protein] reductase
MVTGGGTGFGRAVAERFAQDGDQVFITGRRSAVLDEACAALGGDIHALPCDGTDPAAVEHAAGQVGTVDVLVNNAGGNTDFAMPDETGLKATFDRWRANLDANLTSAVLMTEALDGKLASGGSVVHIGSIGAEQGGSYGAAKAALASWNVGLAKQFGERRITTNVVAPGYFPGTDFFGDGLPGKVHEHLISLTALGRHGEPDEIAGAVHFLASPQARFITGQVLGVNGGAHATR